MDTNISYYPNIRANNSGYVKEEREKTENVNNFFRQSNTEGDDSDKEETTAQSSSTETTTVQPSTSSCLLHVASPHDRFLLAPLT